MLPLATPLQLLTEKWPFRANNPNAIPQHQEHLTEESGDHSQMQHFATSQPHMQHNYGVPMAGQFDGYDHGPDPTYFGTAHPAAAQELGSSDVRQSVETWNDWDYGAGYAQFPTGPTRHIGMRQGYHANDHGFHNAMAQSSMHGHQSTNFPPPQQFVSPNAYLQQPHFSAAPANAFTPFIKGEERCPVPSAARGSVSVKEEHLSDELSSASNNSGSVSGSEHVDTYENDFLNFPEDAEDDEDPEDDVPLIRRLESQSPKHSESSTIAAEVDTEHDQLIHASSSIGSDSLAERVHQIQPQEDLPNDVEKLGHNSTVQENGRGDAEQVTDIAPGTESGRIMEIDWKTSYQKLQKQKQEEQAAAYQRDYEKTRQALQRESNVEEEQPIMEIDWHLSQYEATLTTTEDGSLPMAKISFPGLVREELLLTPESSQFEFHILQNVFLPQYQISHAQGAMPPDPRLTLINYHTITLIVLRVYEVIKEETGVVAKDADPDEVFLSAIDNWRIGVLAKREKYTIIRGVQEFCDVALEITFWVKEHGLPGYGKSSRRQRSDKGVKRGPRSSGANQEKGKKPRKEKVEDMEWKADDGNHGPFGKGSAKGNAGRPAKVNILVAKPKTKNALDNRKVKSGRVEKATRKK